MNFLDLLEKLFTLSPLAAKTLYNKGYLQKLSIMRSPSTKKEIMKLLQQINAYSVRFLHVIII